jgi:hypothetical protein
MHVFRLPSLTFLLVLVIERWDVVSGASFYEERVRAETLAQALNVLVQRVPKFDEYSPVLLVASCGKKI